MNTHLMEGSQRNEQNFIALLYIPEFVNTFSQFLKDKYCFESLEFVQKLDDTSPHCLQNIVNICNTYFNEDTEKELNIASGMKEDIMMASHVFPINLCTLWRLLQQAKSYILSQLKVGKYVEFCCDKSQWQNFAALVSKRKHFQHADISFVWNKPWQSWNTKEVGLWLTLAGFKEASKKFQKHDIEGWCLREIGPQELTYMKVQDYYETLLEFINDTCNKSFSRC